MLSGSYVQLNTVGPAVGEVTGFAVDVCILLDQSVGALDVGARVVGNWVVELRVVDARIVGAWVVDAWVVGARVVDAWAADVVVGGCVFKAWEEIKIDIWTDK